MLEQALFISFAVALGCLALLLSRFGRAVLDRPNERSLHQHPVPRTGGVAVAAGAALAVAIGARELWLPFSLAAALAYPLALACCTDVLPSLSARVLSAPVASSAPRTAW